MNSIDVETEFEQFNYYWKRYFKYIGLDFAVEKENRKTLLIKIIALLIDAIFIYQLALFIAYSDVEMAEKSRYISPLSFSLASFGRILTFLKAKSELMQCIERFRNIYPSKNSIQHYNLTHYLLQFRRVELILLSFMHGINLVFWLLPILVAFLHFIFTAGSSFDCPLLLDLYYPFSVDESWLGFTFAYIVQIIMIYSFAFIILSCDLCLFSLLIQLCMHFDLIGKRISEINGAYERAEEQLKKQIAYHQEILELCDDVNRIFAPSLTFSLMSSCFILCFNGFQLLDDMPMQTVIRTLFLLGYEFKQVVITCYYGDKLMENSERLFYELYSHNWIDGSSRYKKLVLIAMCRMRHPSALNVAKISNLNLSTLKLVLNTSYQAFTLLRTSN